MIDNISYTHATVCDYCNEPLLIELEKKEESRDDLFIYGETCIEVYGDHVRISISDWDKIKQRLIPVLKQGDMKHGSTETGHEKESNAPSGSGQGSTDIGASHW